MVAVQNLCQRVIWLQDGCVMEDGPTNKVLSKYLTASFSAQTEQSWPDPTTAPGNEKVRLHQVRIRPENGQPGDAISLSTPLVVELEYWNPVPNARLHVCLHVVNEQQIVAFTTSSNETDPMTQDNPLSAGLYRSVCCIPGNFLNSGMHRINAMFLRNGLKIVFRHENALVFEVLELEQRRGAWYGKEPGAVHPRLDWKTEHVDQTPRNSTLTLIADQPAFP
jgi:lipopolysaccharide transport system ATP-binding protein